MFNAKPVLITTTEIVLFLIVGFNGYTWAAAPPKSLVGGVPIEAALSSAALGGMICFLVMKSWTGDARGAGVRQRWRVAATALAIIYVVLAICYGRTLAARTFTYASDLESRTVLVAGTELTAVGDSVTARIRRKTGRTPLPGELVALQGSHPTDITTLWTAASIVRSHNLLVLLYTTMLLLLAGALASALEAFALSSSKAP